VSPEHGMLAFRSTCGYSTSKEDIKDFHFRGLAGVAAFSSIHVKDEGIFILYNHAGAEERIANRA
jgi:hypothetical protein